MPQQLTQRQALERPLAPAQTPPSPPQLLQEMEQENLLVPRAGWE